MIIANWELRLYLKTAYQIIFGPVYDLVLIAPPSQSEGWILEAICKEIVLSLDTLRCVIVPSDKAIPHAKKYFFSHYMYFVQAVRSHKILHFNNGFIWFTHFEPGKHKITNQALIELIALSGGIVCANKKSSEILMSLGIEPTKLDVVIGAADSFFFKNHERLVDGCIGFCSAFYERKNPDLVLNIIKLMPSRKFILLGKGWGQYKNFQEMSQLPNFEYIETSYDQYPSYYSKMSVFVSVSSLEGGPIPVIEAMMSNVVPVISDTGFARDLVEHEFNGYIFPSDSCAESIVQYIEKAFENTCDVRSTVVDKNWENFSKKIESFVFKK
jgi:glycosyltransferase involved in cell wall biosynthesis